MANAAKIDYTFNWFYVDNRDTGYFVSGLDPVRPTNVDPTLPTWGTGNAEWTGLSCPRSQHVHEVNPPQGFFVSWNNKPAPGFAAADDQYGYGQVFRSIMLVNQLQGAFAAHPGGVTRAQVVQAMETAASQDLDGLTIVPLLLQYLSGRTEPAGVTAMLGQLQSWVDDGAHRRKAAPGDTQYAARGGGRDRRRTRAAADPRAVRPDPRRGRGVRERLQRAADAVGRLRRTSTRAAPTTAATRATWWPPCSSCSGSTRPTGSARRSPRRECSGGPATCAASIDAALQQTYDALVTANGSSDVASLDGVLGVGRGQARRCRCFDAIQFRALGLVGQPAIDWQNRPTFQQVIEFPRHRAAVLIRSARGSR